MQDGIWQYMDNILRLFLLVVLHHVDWISAVEDINKSAGNIVLLGTLGKLFLKVWLWIEEWKNMGRSREQKKAVYMWHNFLYRNWKTQDQ